MPRKNKGYLRTRTRDLRRLNGPDPQARAYMEHQVQKTKYFANQREVVDRLVASCPKQKGMLLADQMGAGKTISALLVLFEFPGKRPVILCPHFIRHIYAEQAIKFIGRPLPPATKILSFEELSVALQTPQMFDDCILIIDEGHYLLDIKDATLLRNAVAALQTRPFKTIVLTGTPISTSIHDITPLINIAAGKEVVPYREADFRKKFYSSRPVLSTVWGYLVGLYTNRWTNISTLATLIAWTLLSLRHRGSLDDMLNKYVPNSHKLDMKLSIRDLRRFEKSSRWYEENVKIPRIDLTKSENYPTVLKKFLHDEVYNPIDRYLMGMVAKQALGLFQGALGLGVAAANTALIPLNRMLEGTFLSRLPSFSTVVTDATLWMADKVARVDPFHSDAIRVYFAPRATRKVWDRDDEGRPAIVDEAITDPEEQRFEPVKEFYWGIVQDTVYQSVFRIKELVQDPDYTLKDMLFPTLSWREVVHAGAQQYLRRIPVLGANAYDVLQTHAPTVFRAVQSVALASLYATTAAILTTTQRVVTSDNNDDFYRKLDYTKVRKEIGPYLHFYQLTPGENGVAFSEHNIVTIAYSSLQVGLWTRFVYNQLSHGDCDALGMEVWKDSTMGLQVSDDVYLDRGRMISNAFIGGEYPEKFVRCFELMRQGGWFAVIYTEFDVALKTLERFLRHKQNEVVFTYDILRPEMDSSKRQKLIDAFSQGGIDVLLLSPRMYEGLSILRARQFHILDSTLSYKEMAQLQARVVRARAHDGVRQPVVKYYAYVTLLGTDLMELLTKLHRGYSKVLNSNYAYYMELAKLWIDSNAYQSRLPRYYNATIQQTVTPECLAHRRLKPMQEFIATLQKQITTETHELPMVCCPSYKGAHCKPGLQTCAAYYAK